MQREKRPEKLVFFNRVSPPWDAATGNLLGQIVEELSSEWDAEVCHLTISAKELRRSIGYFLYYVKAILCALTLSRRCVAVVWTDPPLLDTIIGWLVLLRGRRLIVVVQDVYPEILQREGFLKSTGIVMSVLQAWRRYVYKGAMKVVTICDEMAKVLEVATGLRNDSITIIPNWANVAGDRPQPSSRSGHGPLLAVYSGNLGIAFDVDLLQETLSFLTLEDDVRLIVRGEGKHGQRVRMLSDQYPNLLLYKPFVSKERLGEAMQESDLFFLLTPHRLVGTLFPSKFYNYLASGRPVLASIEGSSSLHRVIDELGVGRSIVPSARNLAEAFRYFARMKKTNPGLLTEMGARGIDFTTSNWNGKRALETYRDVLLSSLEGSQRKVKDEDTQRKSA